MIAGKEENMGLEVPERYQYLSEREIDTDFLVDMCDDERYPTIAAAVVMCRYGLSRYAQYCDEDVAMDMLARPVRRTLADYAAHFKAAKRGEFDKCLGAVFFEALARKNDRTSCFRIARYYRDGRHVPKDDYKAGVYLKRAAALGLMDAHIAISKSSFGEVEPSSHAPVRSRDLAPRSESPRDPSEPRNPIAMYAKGKEAEDRGDYEKALEWYGKSLDQNYYCAYGGIIRVYLNESWEGFDLEAAENAAEEAIEVHPPVCSILVTYYADHIGEHPEYKELIEQMLLRMYVKGYTPAQNIVRKYKARGILD